VFEAQALRHGAVDAIESDRSRKQRQWSRQHQHGAANTDSGVAFRPSISWSRPRRDH